MSVAKPKYTHSIVNIKANEVMPETLLKKLCSEFNSGVGLVVREPNKLVIEKFLALGTPEEQFTLVNQINKATQKFTRQLTFLAAPDEFDEDEAQPWTPIKDSKGNALLVVSVEGDFPGRTSKEGFSESYVLMHEYLGPKLEDVFKLSGNNPTKLFEFLNSASFAGDLKNVYGFRGAFAFMPSVGEPTMLGDFREEGKGGSDYTWGTCTFNCGYTEAVVEAATPIKEATMPKNPPKVSKYADIPVEPTSVPAVPLKTDPPSDPIEKVAKEIVEETVDWAPPKGIHGKPLKKAYRDMMGFLPENWQDRPSFRIKAKTEVSSLKDLDQTTAKQTAKDMVKDAPKVVLPVIDGIQQGKAVEFIKKFLGDGSLVIDNPLESQRQEATLAVFSELCLRTGDLDEINGWPVSGIFALVKQHPEVAALLVIQLRRDRINRKDSHKTLGELVGTGTPSTPGPLPTPVPDTTKTEPKPSTSSPEAPPLPEVRRSKYA